MPANRKGITEAEILEAWHQNPSVSALADRFKCSTRNINARVQRLRSEGHQLDSWDKRSKHFVGGEKIRRKARLETELKNGIAIIGSDFHYWPGEPSTAHKAFLKFIRELRPSVVVLNGDVFDGASISRWERIGWDSRPTVKQELDACTERLTEIEDAAKGAERYWPLGNHCARFETFLAKNAPQYEGVEFFSLKDRFPKWKPCWSLFCNDTVIKHRFKGGIHATHNNTVWAGKSIVTGHLHSLKVTPFSDLNGTRYGVDTGTMADVYGGQFTDYMEDNPRNWRSGFAVLTYWNGKLLWPELVHVLEEGKVEFRGKVTEV